MGKPFSDWRGIQREVRKPGFVKGVLEFRSEDIQPKHRSIVTKKYLEGGKWDVARIDRASKACGPLAQWCQSQVCFVGGLLDLFHFTFGKSIS